MMLKGYHSEKILITEEKGIMSTQINVIVKRCFLNIFSLKEMKISITKIPRKI
jgi:hypothetical protein